MPDEKVNLTTGSAALEQLAAAAAGGELATAAECARLAKGFAQLGEAEQALFWATRVVDCGADFRAWQSAAAVLRRVADLPPPRRSVRVAVLGSYTTTEFVRLLPLACRRLGVAVEVYEAGFNQYRQEVLDPRSGLYTFEPDVVLLLTHDGELQLPGYSAAPQDDVRVELERWTGLWQTFRERSGARLMQTNFATPAQQPWGHLAARLSGSRQSMTAELNRRLGAAAGSDVSIVDCEQLSAGIGKSQWSDPKYWYLAKHAVALGVLPHLVRSTAAIIAADLGLSSKCIVLDLDNTLWGGVIGEDGLHGIQLGQGPDGEAFVDFQRYLLSLKQKGLILAVCSKNNEADARLPFREHPDMQIKLDDIALFVANWHPKPDNLRHIAGSLNLGLEALLFIDDNPAERAAVRSLVPEVEVITMPADASQYVSAVANHPRLETAWYTPEDAQRTQQYQARTQVDALRTGADSLEDFYRGLQMTATVAPFDTLNLPRIVQLIGKTNQFNLTTRRYSTAHVQQLMADPDCVHLYCRLRDRFADHGLVGLLIARRMDSCLEIDTWLMSCRVIGRTVERMLLAELSDRAVRMGCSTLRGTFIPTEKNGLVRDLYTQLGFSLVEDSETLRRWTYDLEQGGPLSNEFIRVISAAEEEDHAASSA